ncbi:MAG: RecX family transcriptional regulator [Clostridia bacterium]|nr:RecX family transcriptional regulator [Clostridia bacterium]
MKTITDILPQKNNPTRCSVYLDNSFYCGLELETVMRARLKKGMGIEEEELDEIQLESERVRATDKALNFISKSAKTERQVRDYLCQKGYTQKTVDEVISKMGGYGFIDDENYADEYVKSLSGKKGKRLIFMELKKRGVSDDLASRAIDGASPEKEADGALALARKYVKNKLIDRDLKLKCYKHLLSKGFDYDVAKDAVDKLSEDEDY